jgi:hypothetical protein
MADNKTTTPTKSQDRIFSQLRSFRGMAIIDAEALGYSSRSISIRFEYEDASHQGLKDDSFMGHVIVGPNGGIKGDIAGLGFGSIDYAIENVRDLHVALSCLDRTEVTRHTNRVQADRAIARAA